MRSHRSPNLHAGLSTADRLRTRWRESGILTSRTRQGPLLTPDSQIRKDFEGGALARGALA
jgi:hypothetical protein